MMECPECKGQVPDGAKRCMHCGFSPSAYARRRQLTLAAIVLAIVGGVVLMVLYQSDQAEQDGRDAACEQLAELGSASDDC